MSIETNMQSSSEERSYESAFYSSPRNVGSSASSVSDKLLEPIAIIGMSCRLPGSSQDISSFWEMLTAGRTAWTPTPRKRFNMAAFQDPFGNRSGMTNTRGGHFLKEDIAAFDAAFFNIHPAEASAMDPQHRLLLEIAYECFENANLSLQSLRGTKTGVYVGQWSNDYHEIETRDIDAPPLYLTTGTGPAISSNRISYFFDLRGPSFTVDTGCSSSLVALHQAVQSLRSGETSQCFVGGVNLLLDPQRFVYQGKLKMFSDEGRSFAFDSRANGYGRGEGCTGVMLKPLSAALRDGDHVRAVIRNSVLNQDGRTSGLTVPSPEAQEDAIITAYQDALLYHRPDYIEAHGTGTRVGDPKEMGAIAAAFSRFQDITEPIPVGSVKANIGHTESAAGLAGLIKAVLMLEHGMIPPQANFVTPNQGLFLKQKHLRIPTQLERKNLKRISINSFGYGGTNAHVIVDSLASIYPPSHQSHAHQTPTLAPKLFFLSAASEKSCQKVCSRLSRYLVVAQRSGMHDETLLARLAHTLARRSIYPYRLTFVAASINELVSQLCLASCSTIPRSNEKDGMRIGFVFSGQGAQYAEMGRELLSANPTYAKTLERANSVLFKLGCKWDLVAELCKPKETTRINEPEMAQPISIAVQLALVDSLAHVGITPCAVLGHSSGEIAAAFAAKAISFEDAMTIAYFRGKLTSDTITSQPESSGAMMAVGAEPAAVHKIIENIAPELGRVRIACFNGPTSVTVSGDACAMDQLKELLDKEKIFNRKLQTSGAAYHSHQMEAISEQYRSILDTKLTIPEVAIFNASVCLFSSVTGVQNKQCVKPGAAYWVDNLVSPVLFTQGLHSMCVKKYQGEHLDVILEVGSHSQLAGAVKQGFQSLSSAGVNQITYTSTLKRGENAAKTLLECAGVLYKQTAALSLDKLNGFEKDQQPRLLADIPPYSFDHDRTFWHETRISRDYRYRQYSPHELLGTFSLDINRVEPRWRRFLSLKESSWLKGHRVQGQIVFPGAGFITMAVQAMRQHGNMTQPHARIESLLLRNVSISRALVLQEDGLDKEIVLSLRPEPLTASKSSTLWNEFRIFSVEEDDTWIEHCRGLIQAESSPTGVLEIDTENILAESAQCTHVTAPQKLYHLGRAVGLDWQYPFNNVTSVRTSHKASTIVARQSSFNPQPGGMGDILHPAMLDSCLFHGLCAIQILEQRASLTFVPNFIKQLRIYNRPQNPTAEFTSSSKVCKDPSSYDLVIHNTDKSLCKGPLLVAEGIHTARLPGDTHLSQELSDICHIQAWVTYVDAWTPAHRNTVCKSLVAPGKSLEQNHLLDALTLHFVQRAMDQIVPEHVPEGARYHFLQWMQIFASATETSTRLPDGKPSPDIMAFYEGIMRLGPRLADILTEKIDPLSLLTPDNLLNRLYCAERCNRCIVQIAEYCHELGKQWGNLDILEIGAGTASATLPVLQALNGREDRYCRSYAFTDLSPGFFEPAKERMQDLVSVVDFSILDIERSPAEQGFGSSKFDLIIASNVIHATQSIDGALANIRSLLKPNGKFVLMELTVPTPHYNLLFGVFKGWWAGYNDGRKLSPLISRTEWVKRLQDAGFSATEMCFEDYPEADGGSISVFISTAPCDTVAPTLPPIQFVTNTHTVSGQTENTNPALLAAEGFQEYAVSVSTITTPTLGRNIVFMMPDIATLLCSHIDNISWKGFKEWILNARAVVLVSCTEDDKLHATTNGLWLGFARCLRLEHPEIRIITLQLDAERRLLPKRLLEVFPALLRSVELGIGQQGGEEFDNEFIEKDGQLFVSRIVVNQQIGNYVRCSRGLATPETVTFMRSGRILTAELRVPGLLETIRWKEDTKVSPLGPDDVKLELRAASINFKDVLIAAGQLDGITEMRNDCSGIVVEVGHNMAKRFKVGDHVCALYSRSYTNYPIVHGDCVQVIPENLTFEEAASLPVVWTTVLYSLIDIGRLQKGDKILIHSAAGAVGQAAIMLAQYLGAEIYATVGNEAKRALIRDKYGVPEDHIFSSRTPEFYNGIRHCTGGYGVDVVLSSLSGEMFRHSCNLMAPFGRFVEIGRKDLMDDARMSMEFLLQNITFAYVDLTMIMEKRTSLARRLLQKVTNLVATGCIKPVTLTTMPISEIETAFRLIQAGKHTGKVVLQVEKDQKVMADPPKPVQAQMRADATYLVVGGFGGLGRAIVTWLGERGAKTVLCLSRSGLPSKENKTFTAEMLAKGVKVIAEKGDVTSQDEITSVVEKAAKDGLPPIRGVIQSAMVLKDSVFEEMTVEEWQGAVAPKVAGSLNLHRCFGSEVDFFILLSSAVALRGNVGQSNYAAGCSVQDAIARYRRSAGLPAFSINVGPVLEVGFVSENPHIAAALKKQGLGTISISDLLAMLNFAISNQHSDENVCAIGMIPEYADLSLADRRFARLVRNDIAHGAKGTKDQTADIPRLLETAASPEETGKVISQAILQQLGKLIALPVEMLSASQSLDSYGVDSLVAVELRNWVGAVLQANIPLMVLRGANSINELAGIVAKGSRLVKVE